MPDMTPINAFSGPANGSPDEIEGAMWQMKIDDGREGTANGQVNQFPLRPGEPDCIYYLRTGVCGYGSKCRYNHPNLTEHGAQYAGELPQRVGQPDCQFFLKTGACKYGTTCKYHHPLDKHDELYIQLNIYGLPMRQDEKSCPYYMRYGSCKFGIACKFNHPQPPSLADCFPGTGPSVYGYRASSAPPTGPTVVGGSSSWSLSRLPYMSNPHLSGITNYMPLVLPSTQDILPMQQGWNIYMGGGSTPAFGTLPPNLISNSKLQGKLGSSMTIVLPEKPDQPECQYYMRTGSCKYGSSCKYHHPRERNQDAEVNLGPLVLPLRPGEPVCKTYTTYGYCKYGTTCKYDHPFMGYYGYSLPAFSFQEPAAYFTSPLQNRSQVKLTLVEDSSAKTLKVLDEAMKSETSLRKKERNNHEHEDTSQQTSPSHTSVPPEST